MYDLNDADKQSSFELIPAKTVIKAVMKINPGQAGEDGWLTESKNSDAEMIAAEFIVLEGEYIKRRWWQYLVVSGGKLDDRGRSIAGNISRKTLRAILESAKNIKPDDEGPEAVRKRQINGWGDFNGLEFVCRVGIEKDKSGQYDDKNKILEVITPDMKEYKTDTSIPFASPAAFTSPPSQTKPANNVPAWAQ